MIPLFVVATLVSWLRVVANQDQFTTDQCITVDLLPVCLCHMHIDHTLMTVVACQFS